MLPTPSVIARCVLLVLLALPACSLDLSGLDEELCKDLGCDGGEWAGYAPDLTITGSVFVGGNTVAEGQAEVQLISFGAYTAPPDLLPVSSSGAYMQTFNGEVAAAVCGWSAQARLSDGRVSDVLPLFEEPPPSCSGSLDAVDFHFPPS